MNLTNFLFASKLVNHVANKIENEFTKYNRFSNSSHNLVHFIRKQKLVCDVKHMKDKIVLKLK